MQYVSERNCKDVLFIVNASVASGMTLTTGRFLYVGLPSKTAGQCGHEARE